MRFTPRAGAAALALICSLSIGSMAAIAQTGGQPSQTSGQGAASPTIVTPKGQINPQDDQGQALINSLEGLVNQALPGFLPSLGASVPQSVKTTPMPADAKAALPQEAKQALPNYDNHHVAKTDDGTIMIIDPTTGQIVGMIHTSDGSLALGGPDSQKGQQDQKGMQPQGQGMQPGSQK